MGTIIYIKFMLDFYQIYDDTSKPDWPEKANLKMLGSLNLRDFVDLEKKKIISKTHHYFTDNRWNYKSTLQLYKLMLAKYPKLKDDTLRISSVNTFFKIVKAAVKDNVGLIAYCD